MGYKHVNYRLSSDVFYFVVLNLHDIRNKDTITNINYLDIEITSVSRVPVPPIHLEALILALFNKLRAL